MQQQQQQMMMAQQAAIIQQQQLALQQQQWAIAASGQQQQQQDIYSQYGSTAGLPGLPDPTLALMGAQVSFFLLVGYGGNCRWRACVCARPGRGTESGGGVRESRPARCRTPDCMRSRVWPAWARGKTGRTWQAWRVCPVSDP